MALTRRSLPVLAIVAVTLIGAAMRLRAVDLLPIDYDEDDYLLAANYYAQTIREGDIGRIVNFDYNSEHPLLTKLVYALPLLPLAEIEVPDTPSSSPPAAYLPPAHFLLVRLTAAALGALQVLAVAIFNPLAGLLLAINTWHIKYTSQIMLEPLPSLASTLMVLCYVAWKKRRRRANAWLVASAILLGVTAGAKYPYCLAGLAVVIDMLWRPTETPAWPSPPSWASRLRTVLGWGLLGVVIFFAVDPYLWAEPLSRLKASLLFHVAYAQSQHVAQAGFPVWQPLVWLSGPVPWHPGVFLLPLDLFTSVLAVLGLRRLWNKERVFVLWLGITLAFLLVWITKWPQYILMLSTPLVIAAGEGFNEKVLDPLKTWARSRVRRAHPVVRRESIEVRPETRKALPWLLPGAIALVVLALFPLVFQGAMALTDFRGSSLRDGIRGGVWREVWLGLTGQHPAVPVEPFSTSSSGGSQVHYSGPALIWNFLTGSEADILFFDGMWAVLSVASQVGLGLGAALLLAGGSGRSANRWRSLFILPWAIPEFIGALVWLRIFEPGIGWLSMIVPEGVHLPASFSSKEYALVVLLISAMWYGFPFIMIAASAGLKMIPPEVHDAAAIDGAGPWAQFRHVTWPLLVPLLAPAIIIRGIAAFNQFYLFYTMNTPYPLMTLATLSFYVFSSGREYAVAAAINVVTVIFLIILVLWFDRWARASEGVTYV